MALDPITAVQTALGINRKATVIAIGGFVVIALAIGLTQMLDGAALSFWPLLAALVAMMVLMIGLTALPVMARRLISWVVALSFTAITLAATAQAVTRNGIPGLAPLSCLASFYFAASCDLSPVGDGVAAAAPAAPGADAGLVVPGAEPATTPDMPDNARLFIQFAGYPRDKVVALATTIDAQGWHVNGAARGGERVSSAAGLNEVRFFHAGDKSAAQALAAAIGDNLGGEALEVKDLSGTAYGRPDRGYFEAWISG